MSGVTFRMKLSGSKTLQTGFFKEITNIKPGKITSGKARDEVIQVVAQLTALELSKEISNAYAIDKSRYLQGYQYAQSYFRGGYVGKKPVGMWEIANSYKNYALGDLNDMFVHRSAGTIEVHTGRRLYGLEYMITHNKTISASKSNRPANGYWIRKATPMMLGPKMKKPYIYADASRVAMDMIKSYTGGRTYSDAMTRLMLKMASGELTPYSVVNMFV